MASDFHATACTSTLPETAARGALNYAIACLTGFGVQKDVVLFYEWLHKSVRHGLPVSRLVSDLLQSQTFADTDPRSSPKQFIDAAVKTDRVSMIAKIVAVDPGHEHFHHYCTFMQELVRKHDAISKVPQRQQLLLACKEGNSRVVLDL